MLDIQFIRDNAELVKEKSKQKNVQVSIDKLLELDEQRRSLTTIVDELREQRNKLTANLTQKPSEDEIKKGTSLKEEISDIEKRLGPINEDYLKLLKQVPNIPTDDTPVGSSEEDNVVTKTWGEIKKFDFEPKTHWELGEARDLIDKERATQISGNRFVYLKGGLVEMQFAIIQFVISELSKPELIQKLIDENRLSLSNKPFTPILPPLMLRTAAYEATGRLKAEDTTYKLADDDLWLIASAEHSLCSMYMNEILDESDLPIRYLGYSTSFRREAGSYGKDTNGITRMHHFDKLEMEVFSTAETSLQEHLLLIAIQEYLVRSLELPYRVILKSTADIGDPNARGVDIDLWLPGQKLYRESHSADYMGDFQARDLKTRARSLEGDINLVHTNDATAFALGRTLAAIIENNQTEEGHITVPKILRPYMAGKDQI